jgi:hypothetical protein
MFSLRRTSRPDRGPDAIIEAVYASGDVYDVNEATMGMPRLHDFGTLRTNYKVVIPLEVDIDDVSLPPFIFDLPDDRVLGDDDFGRLARLYDVDTIEDIAFFVGQSVPLAWNDGYPHPELNRLEGECDDE